MLVQNIYGDSGSLLAIRIYSRGDGEPNMKEGIDFITDPDLPLQFATIKHPKGKVIKPHAHQFSSRIITRTLEVLVVLSGILKVSLYDNMEVQITYLTKGEAIILINGGHGFEVIEDVEMYEIKQGPFYSTEMDKIYLDKDLSS